MSSNKIITHTTLKYKKGTQHYKHVSNTIITPNLVTEVKYNSFFNIDMYVITH